MRSSDRRCTFSTQNLCALLFLIVTSNALAQGSLTNGWQHTGAIAPVGHSDTWTFSANTGDRIVIRVGEISQTNSFSPRIRLQNPNAVQMAAAFGATAAEIAVTATNTGTFTVIVDDAAGTTATGTYRLTLVKSPGQSFVAPGDEGGPLTNGAIHTGAIQVGDLDIWTITANAGDSITARIGETVSGSALTPALWLYGPTGALLDSGSGAAAIEVYFRATNSGTFMLVAGDFSAGYAGSGAYRLTVAKTGDPVVVSGGDEGGPLTNGVVHTGVIDVGDLDVWTITATAGDSITVRIGESVSGSAFSPALWLYGPTGALLDSASGAVAAEVFFRATNSGAFMLVVGDFSAGYAGSGGYRLNLAKTGEPFIVSDGDEGGTLTNGLIHTGTIQVGDLDLWTINATSGESLTVRIGETAGGAAYTPAFWLYGPSGALLDSSEGAVAAEVYFRATNSGTFLLVVGDFSAGFAGTGSYRLTLARTAVPALVSPGDEGGAMTNGIMHLGAIDVGDLDVWNITAAAGESILVRMGETVSGSALTPAIWLYGPTGALLDSEASAAAAEIYFRATNSGLFTLVAGDFSAGYAGTGGYRLTLAKTGDRALVSAGDEGGVMTGAGVYHGTIATGDLDVYTFTACPGEIVSLQMNEATNASPLTPLLRLFGRDGALLNSISGPASAQISRFAPLGGNYMVVLGDFSTGYAGTGNYTLTVNGLVGGAKLCAPAVAASGNVTVSGVGGNVNSTYVLLTHTNLAVPVPLWPRVMTNQFDQFGVFIRTNAFTPREPERYFILELP